MSALQSIYHSPSICGSGPMLEHAIKDGTNIICRFRDARGLHTSPASSPVIGFEVLSQDRTWTPVRGCIRSSEVILHIPDGLKPVGVRYAWSNNPKCNLYNDSELPSAPFQTAL